jgi:hypothetical protein
MPDEVIVPPVADQLTLTGTLSPLDILPYAHSCLLWPVFTDTAVGETYTRASVEGGGGELGGGELGGGELGVPPVVLTTLTHEVSHVAVEPRTYSWITSFVAPSALLVTVIEHGDVQRSVLMAAILPEEPIHHFTGVATSVLPLNARAVNRTEAPTGPTGTVSSGVSHRRVALPGATVPVGAGGGGEAGGGGAGSSTTGITVTGVV